MDELDALSPLDGRYLMDVETLIPFFSEQSLMQHRLEVEGEYLIALSQHQAIGLRCFSEDETDMIRQLYDLSSDDARVVKAIEISGCADTAATKDDVKAIEYYMRDRLRDTSLGDSLEWIHFGLTSEDVNNLSYGLMLGSSLKEVMLPAVMDVETRLDDLAYTYRNVPMLTRTHGQPASPTTLGKEFRVFFSRLERQLKQLDEHEILVKLNGASGNYNAHHAAYPHVDWIAFTNSFVATLARNRNVTLKVNVITTQIEPHDTYAELFDNLKRLNTILINFDQNLWRYISDGWIIQKPKEGDVGSSTMPRKVNPIDFENSEGNLGLANALFEHFSRKLSISRLQRDLSDSTVLRNIGVAFGHSLLGYTSLLRGLDKISIDEEKISAELDAHPEVIAEPFQTILRREGFAGAYEQLEKLTKGKIVTLDDFRKFIDGLEVSDSVKDELRAVRPRNYTGLASSLADR